MRKSQDRSDPQNPTDPQGQTPLSSCHCPVHCGSVALLNSNIQPLPQECLGSNVPRAPSNPPSNLSGDFQCGGTPGPKCLDSDRHERAVARPWEFDVLGLLLVLRRDSCRPCRRWRTGKMRRGVMGPMRRMLVNWSVHIVCTPDQDLVLANFCDRIFFVEKSIFSKGSAWP